MFKATITLVTSDRITLACDDGQTLTLPVSSFEGTPKIGLEVVIVVAVLGDEVAGHTKLAHDLLNELLKG